MLYHVLGAFWSIRHYLFGANDNEAAYSVRIAVATTSTPFSFGRITSLMVICWLIVDFSEGGMCGI